MKKNGFTLVELIGTILILSLMMLIIIPVVSKSMKSGIEDADKKAKANIELAAQNYVADNGLNEFTASNSNTKKISDSSYCITISHLQNNGYLEENLKKPSDSTSMTGKVNIGKSITSSKKVKYTFTYATGTC